jgi:hypothetical protein
MIPLLGVEEGSRLRDRWPGFQLAGGPEELRKRLNLHREHRTMSNDAGLEYEEEDDTEDLDVRLSWLWLPLA